ncbi:DUF2213 domain-containing protein [Nostoc piscinale]|uniref:DUF2213 domain-containing protein n=1 Tax=Nostoc piscinale TaxID=224012 RepID=UPI000782218D|nr:DUF2213 domain-containing protein [Nostoc piscinale]
MEYRVDTGGINKYEITPEGYLRAWATIARIGVQTYYNADGTPRRELRPPEEVADPESLASFGLKPHTVDHPPEFLNSENTKLYQTGFTDSTVYYQQGFVNVAISVTDAKAIDEIASGRKRELSAGYTCELDFTPGVWRGQNYDAIQRRIRGNHVSSIEVGRAGPNVKIHIDEMPWVSRPLKKKAFIAKLDNHETAMTVEAKEKIDEQTKDTPPRKTESREDVQARRIKELEARIDDRDSTVNQLREELSTTKTELTQAKTDAATAKSDLEHHKATYDSAIASEVTARIDAWQKAKPFLPKALAQSPDPKMTADEIKRAAVENDNPGVKLDGYNSDRIDGMFEFMLHSKKPKADKTKGIMKAVENAFNAGDAKASRSKAMCDDDKAWMTTN